MAIASLVDLNLNKAAPFIGVAALALAIWYIWSKSRQQMQQDAQSSGGTLGTYQQAADLALIQSFTGGAGVPTQATTSTGTTTPMADPLLPAYSAPGNPSQNLTAPALGSISLGPATATSNGI